MKFFNYCPNSTLLALHCGVYCFVIMLSEKQNIFRSILETHEFFHLSPASQVELKRNAKALKAHFANSLNVMN